MRVAILCFVLLSISVWIILRCAMRNMSGIASFPPIIPLFTVDMHAVEIMSSSILSHVDSSHRRNKGSCNIGYPFETHLKLKSHEISFSHYGFLRLMLCPKFETIEQPRNKVWVNVIVQDLGLRYVSDGSAILQQPHIMWNGLPTGSLAYQFVHIYVLQLEEERFCS